MTRAGGDDDGMSVPIRILLAEDSEDDAAIIVQALRRAGYEPTITQVHDRDRFRAALETDVDAIVTDYALPQFGCAEALRLMNARGLDLPFIVVSGTIDEDAAVGILRAGAHDFVTKQNLARLGPALDRELIDARNRAERRRAERSLGHQRDFLRIVLDTNPGLVFVKDSRGRFSLANNAVAELYGTTVDDLLGRSESDYNPNADEVARARAAEEHVLGSGRPSFTAAEKVTDPRTGATRWFEVRRVPLALPDTPDRHVLGIASEITERKSAEDALRVAEQQFRQAQKMEAVGQLAGGVAHDFNNLLTAILGYTALLVEGVRDRPELLADLQEIRRAGERAGALTRQLLTFSRKHVVQPTILNLNEVVAELEKMLHRVIGEDVRLETVLPPTLHHVKADPNQVEQILMNLAVNARDAMPRGGVLRIETANDTMPVDPRQPGSRWPCVLLRVSDTGVGIAADVRDRVFDPFFTTKAPGKGTGLGLSTVYGIVTQSGGVITVDSEPTRGASFSIRFPAVDVPVDKIASDANTVMPHAGTETILLVEDEAGVRHLCQRVLSRRGYDVLEARDVTHAAEISSSFPGQIHLLLSDIVMPGLSGPDLAQRIVAERPDIRVLYMSGFSNRLNTEYGSLSAGVTILHKPFTPEHLVRTVRDCLDVAVS
jgi:two-component system, cell cycle sensor histidine kinase and response regulator CckA